MNSSGSDAGYRLVKLTSGVHSVHSLAFGETFHPVIGPVAEAEALYVRQLRLIERIGKEGEPFVIWDVGLGSAANVLTVLRATNEIDCSLSIHSFDNTIEPLSFALKNASQLPYIQNYEQILNELIKKSSVLFQDGKQKIDWVLHSGDFPSLIAQPTAQHLPKPHGVMFDAYSPATNPAMWTLGLFTNLYKLLEPSRPCALPTYSRSTVLRVTLLLAGFFVGVGHATGEKEETTIAANSMDLIDQPLDRRWLLRACRSHSAEPLGGPVYRQAPLSPDTRDKLEQHPQFQ